MSVHLVSTQPWFSRHQLASAYLQPMLPSSFVTFIQGLTPTLNTQQCPLFHLQRLQMAGANNYFLVASLGKEGQRKQGVSKKTRKTSIQKPHKHTPFLLFIISYLTTTTLLHKQPSPSLLSTITSSSSTCLSEVVSVTPIIQTINLYIHALIVQVYKHIYVCSFCEYDVSLMQSCNIMLLQLRSSLESLTRVNITCMLLYQ